MIAMAARMDSDSISVSSSSRSGRIRSFLVGRIGMTRSVVLSVGSRGWSSVAGAITVVVVARTLSLVEQGFYFTFWSVLGLQIIFELGFAFVITQFASHERAALRLVDGRMTGDLRARARLASLLQLSVRWYLGAALLMVAMILPTGLIFFSHYSRSSDVHWALPWLLVSVMAAFNLLIVPLAALLEGAGMIEDLSLMRLLQLMTTHAMMWISLTAGARLYATVVFSTTMAFFATCWIAVRHGRLLADLWRTSPAEHAINWRDEIWPFQWRLAVSWVSGYIIFQLFNPILFAAKGEAAAARMGMSLMVALAIAGFGLAWVNARAVDYGALIALRRYDDLDAVFRASLWQSTGAMTILASGFVSVVEFLRYIHHPVADRVLPPLPLVLLLAGVIVNHVFVAEAAYLRAHKREPFMRLTLLMAVLTVGGSLLVVRQMGATGVTLVFLIVVTVVGVGGGTATFLRARRQWRVATGEPESVIATLPDVPGVGI